MSLKKLFGLSSMAVSIFASNLSRRIRNGFCSRIWSMLSSNEIREVIP